MYTYGQFFEDSLRQHCRSNDEAALQRLLEAVPEVSSTEMKRQLLCSLVTLAASEGARGIYLNILQKEPGLFNAEKSSAEDLQLLFSRSRDNLDGAMEYRPRTLQLVKDLLPGVSQLAGLKMLARQFVRYALSFVSIDAYRAQLHALDAPPNFPGVFVTEYLVAEKSVKKRQLLAAAFQADKTLQLFQPTAGLRQFLLAEVDHATKTGNTTLLAFCLAQYSTLQLPKDDLDQRLAVYFHRFRNSFPLCAVIIDWLVASTAADEAFPRIQAAMVDFLQNHAGQASYQLTKTVAGGELSVALRALQSCAQHWLTCEDFKRLLDGVVDGLESALRPHSCLDPRWPKFLQTLDQLAAGRMRHIPLSDRLEIARSTLWNSQAVAAFRKFAQDRERPALDSIAAFLQSLQLSLSEPAIAEELLQLARESRDAGYDSHIHALYLVPDGALRPAEKSQCAARHQNIRNFEALGLSPTQMIEFLNSEVVCVGAQNGLCQSYADCRRMLSHEEHSIRPDRSKKL